MSTRRGRRTGRENKKHFGDEKGSTAKERGEEGGDERVEIGQRTDRGRAMKLLHPPNSSQRRKENRRLELGGCSNFMALPLSVPCSISTLSSPPSSPLSFVVLPFSSPKCFLFSRPVLRPLRVDIRRSYPFVTATFSTSGALSTSPAKGDKKLLLQVNDLRAKVVESAVEILHGVNLTINEGEVHAIMGKNGSGKSTFAKVLVGHPDYEVTGGSVLFKGENLLDMEPEERALAGLFMSFQSPVEIPGVSNYDFLVMAYNARQRKLGQLELGPLEFLPYLMEKVNLVNMKEDFLDRNVNEGFSGGERKRNEILQLAVLGADLAILDEIDSGLDVDALRDVANAVNQILTSKNSLLMITHYRRILDLLNPTHVHIMDRGKIARTGDLSMVEVIEAEGYETVST